MDKLSYGRAVRCCAVFFQDTNWGGMLLSNMFDIHRGSATKHLQEARECLMKHKRNGGSLKDFEDGIIEDGMDAETYNYLYGSGTDSDGERNPNPSPKPTYEWLD